MLEKRDKKRCLYCLISENNCGLRMHVDHIIPVSAGGSTTLDNLCLTCFSCNVYKGAKQTWSDPLTQETVPLFLIILFDILMVHKSPCFGIENFFGEGLF
ncbi:MAG: HNH endonuclease [Deltaproteobacteria bacterium]|nr:HNH endonuclease [Deltaproteobacteria bacterium]